MTIAVGDVFLLKSPVSFETLDANGAPIAGLDTETRLVAVVAYTGVLPGATVYLAPIINADVGILEGAQQVFPFVKE